MVLFIVQPIHIVKHQAVALVDALNICSDGSMLLIDRQDEQEDPIFINKTDLTRIVNQLFPQTQEG